jgi:catechol 2,3-dioxygenase-like lactoylglutathione lyase family enzyme
MNTLPNSVFPESFFHFGIVVPDIERAVAHYSDTFGIQFTEPSVGRSHFVEDPDRHQIELVTAFSRTQPPYLELIQATGEGFFSSKNSGKILYCAVWETDMKGRLERLRTQKVGIDALMCYAELDRAPYGIITAPDAHGLRIEYADVSTRAMIEERIRTGRVAR